MRFVRIHNSNKNASGCAIVNILPICVVHIDPVEERIAAVCAAYGSHGFSPSNPNAVNHELRSSKAFVILIM